jgi:hypothetical protein
LKIFDSCGILLNNFFVAKRDTRSIGYDDYVVYCALDGKLHRLFCETRESLLEAYNNPKYKVILLD